MERSQDGVAGGWSSLRMESPRDGVTKGWSNLSIK